MMAFQVGDKVVHRTFGPGEVLRLEEKQLAGQSRLYYVVQVSKLTLWVPVVGADERSLRFIMEGTDFKKLYKILRSPGEPLTDDRHQRQIELVERMQEGTLEGLCRIIRDLAARSHLRKLNENDSSIMNHALELLLSEWQLSQGMPAKEVRRQLDALLEESKEATQRSVDRLPTPIHN
jgi:CarD family transcriptional regulator